MELTRRHVPPWRRRSVGYLRLRAIEEAIADEAASWPDGSIRRALGRAQRAIRAAALEVDGG